MSREIKFRGYNKEKKKWCYGYLFKKPEWGYYIAEVIKVNNPASDVKGSGFMYVENSVEEESVGQFTGFTDFLYRPIYEGDIISDGQTEYTIEYFAGGFYGVNGDGKIHFINMLYFLFQGKKAWNVVGNVWERKHAVENTI